MFSSVDAGPVGLFRSHSKTLLALTIFDSNMHSTHCLADSQTENYELMAALQPVSEYVPRNISQVWWSE
jgi:hypothetical protein